MALAPLLSGAGVKGTVAEAWLQQLPLVATPIAVEGMHGIHGEAFLVANNSQQFISEFGRLYNDCNLWDRLKAGGESILREQFSYDLVLDKLNLSRYGLFEEF